jgi:hypothetical protein
MRMKTSTRKSLGVAMVVISLLVALALYVSGMPLLTLQESHTSSFPGGFLIVSGFEIHWPLVAVCAFAFLGLAAFVWPERKPPRLQE